VCAAVTNEAISLTTSPKKLQYSAGQLSRSRDSKALYYPWWKWILTWL